jgi:hypothetical protein
VCKCVVKLLTAVIVIRPKHVSAEAFAMQPHQHGFFPIKISFDQGHVLNATEVGCPGAAFKCAVAGRYQR